MPNEWPGVAVAGASLQRRSRGAALTEMVLLLMVMIPLLFAIPMIGKLTDLRQTAVSAGRYATWQATVSPEGVSAPAQVASRFFAEADRALTSDEPSFSSHALWGAMDGDDERDVPVDGDDPGVHVAGGWPRHSAVRIDEATVAVTPWRTADDDLGMAETVGDAVVSAGKALGGSRWDLADTALTRSTIGVDVRMNGWWEKQGVACANGMGGCLHEAGVILVDGWEVGSDAQAENRVKALVPATHLESVGEVLSGLGALPILEELRGVEHMFGHVDMEPLPAHADHGLDIYQER